MSETRRPASVESSRTSASTNGATPAEEGPTPSSAQVRRRHEASGGDEYEFSLVEVVCFSHVVRHRLVIWLELDSRRPAEFNRVLNETFSTSTGSNEDHTWARLQEPCNAGRFVLLRRDVAQQYAAANREEADGGEVPLISIEADRNQIVAELSLQIVQIVGASGAVVPTIKCARRWTPFRLSWTSPPVAQHTKKKGM